MLSGVYNAITSINVIRGVHRLSMLSGGNNNHYQWNQGGIMICIKGVQLYQCYVIRGIVINVIRDVHLYLPMLPGVYNKH